MNELFEKSIQTLELPRVLEMLAGCAVTDEGRELTLYRLFPRDMCLFSASCVLRGIQFDVLVEAERDTTALFLPAEVYQGLMEESAAVANYTSELMADRFSEVMWRMDQILSKKLDGRLAALLVEESRLAESASLRLTHDQLARHLGSAREVVSRGRMRLPRLGGIPARPRRPLPRPKWSSTVSALSSALWAVRMASKPSRRAVSSKKA